MRTFYFIFFGLTSLINIIAATETFTPYWPLGIDGTDVLPENHRLIHESAYTKIIDVFIAAHEAEKPHTHMLRSYMFIDQPTALIVRLVDEKQKELPVFELKESQEIPLRPQYAKIDPESFHYVANTDNRDFHAIRIELKESGNSLDKKLEGLDASIIVQELVANALWDLAIPGKKNSSITTNEYEGILIGNRDSRILVYALVNDKWELHEPVKYECSRPPVWVLNPTVNYLIENPSTYVERIFLLMTPA